MIFQALAIARNAFVESLRQPVVFVLVALSGVLQLLNTWSSAFSMGLSETGEVEGDNKMLLDIGMGTIFVIAMLLAGFIATAVLSREIQNRTILMVIAKPISRPVVVIGKYLGVAGALLVATLPMLIFLLMGIRHGVMSTAADELDGPVLLFTLGSAALSLGLAAWANFYYGWSFSQTAVVLLAISMPVGYLCVLAIGKKWGLQPMGSDFKPQITLACLCLTMAVLVLSAVATAASTRLGQVMTIVVCAGVFLAGLLSNQALGRFAFQNEPVGRIAHVEALDPTREDLRQPGTVLRVDLTEAPAKPIRPGAVFWYASSPGGFPMSVADLAEFGGDPGNLAALNDTDAPATIVVTESDERSLTVRSVGRPRVILPPRDEDYVFPSATRIRPIVLAAWAVVPNLHYFWLLDAVTQNVRVPGSHVALVVFYGLAQVGAFLSLAVVLFQRRDVG